MKKQYIKPQAETLFFEPQALMRPSGHDMNMPDAKESSFDEEKGDYLNDIQFKDIWEDEEE
ncbi:MAG: hypothetical protein IJ891_02460 [Prevotella sp.]|nr:hypothetical protein [Prevotella sp.]